MVTSFLMYAQPGGDCEPIGKSPGIYSPPSWVHQSGSGFAKVFLYSECPFRVGIGTENPQNFFHVTGNSYFQTNIGVGVNAHSSSMIYVRQQAYNRNGVTVDLSTSHTSSSGIAFLANINHSNYKGLSIFNSNENFEVFNVNGAGKMELRSSNGQSPTMEFRTNSTNITEFKFFGSSGNLTSTLSIGTNSGNSFLSFIDHTTGGGGIERFRISQDGTLYARRIKVTVWNFPDYVFDSNYNLMSIYDVDKFIQENGHLPNFEKAKHYEEEGLDINDVLIKQMEKIEELTLYVIQLQKQIDELKKQE